MYRYVSHNRLKCFQNTSTSEIRIFTMYYAKQKPKIVQNRNCNKLGEQLFRTYLNKTFIKLDLNNTELTEFHDEF